MIGNSSMTALAVIVLLGLGCAACSGGGTYGGASPADPRGAASAPGAAPGTAPAAPARVFQPPPSYDTGLGGGGGGGGMGGGY